MSESKIYTLDEAATYLRLTNRAVAKLAKRHGLVMVAGRKMRFTDADVEALKEVMRPQPKAPRPTPMKPSLSDYHVSKSLARLTAKKGKRGKV